MIENLKISDFILIRELQYHQSLRSLSRAFKIEPQNMSKLIKRIETELGLNLVRRSSKGISLTPEAFNLIESFSDVFKLLKQNQNQKIIIEKQEKVKNTTYTLAARGFINACLIPSLIKSADQILPQLKYLVVDASPAKKEEWARLGLVDFIISVEELDLGKNWQSEPVGTFSWNFYCRKGLIVTNPIKREALSQYSILGHAHINDKRTIKEDNFMLEKNSKKSFQHAAETAISGMHISSLTDNFCYIPDLLVKQLPPKNGLQKILLENEPVKSQAVYLNAHIDRVQQRHFKELGKILKNIFEYELS